jgi:hypothetical protein
VVVKFDGAEVVRVFQDIVAEILYVSDLMLD